MDGHKLYNEANGSFHERSQLEKIKKYITGNYATETEVAKVSGLFDILFACGPLPGKLLNKDFLGNVISFLLPLIANNYYSHRQLLLAAGHTAEYIYFSKKGFARGYYIDKRSQREITGFLWSEHSIITVPESFFQQQPTQTFIEVMPETELMSILFHDLRACMKKYPVVEIFSRNVILQYNSYEVKRIRELSFLACLGSLSSITENAPGYRAKSF